MIKLFKNLKPYGLSILGVIILVFIQVMSELFLPTLMGNIVDKGVVKHDITYIWQTGGWMVLVALGGTIAAKCELFILACRYGIW